MAFSKNWKQWIVSKGEPFQNEYLDRKFRGRSRVVFKVDDATGVVTVNGKVMDGDQNITGNVAISGTLATGGNADVGGTLGVDGAATFDAAVAVGTTLAVTGVSTFTGAIHAPVGTVKTKIVAGADASGGAVQTAFTGAVIGSKVVAVIDLNNDADVSSHFETTISVTDKIVQNDTDLSAVTHILVMLHS
jgi:hypothetical protein